MIRSLTKSTRLPTIAARNEGCPGNSSERGRCSVYYSGFYPMHLALLTVANNLMPMAWWTPISKEPFRFLIAMDRKNHTLSLLRESQEAVLNFLPWTERERVVRAGYLTGRRGKKPERLGFRLIPARQLKHTGVVEGGLYGL
jgi:flavin reductase (DIM6/NTAB) family NADH-FMN oxidoreductase RutF